MKCFEIILVKLLSEIQNVFKFRTLFLLGAGVSARYIAPDYNLYKKAKVEISSAISFPVPSGGIDLSNEEQIRFSKLGSQHVLYPSSDGRLLIDQSNMDFYDEVLHHYPKILELICSLTYSLEKYPTFCPEYQILNSANRHSLIANLNHDNLAENFIKNRKVISLHGTITPQVKTVLKEILPYALDRDISKFFDKELVLATQENERFLLKSSNYNKFIDELKFNKFQYIVIIGYSFFKKNDFDVYDIVARDLVRSYIKDYSCKMIIIDPYPEFVASILGISLANCYPVYWDKFCRAFFLVQNLKKLPSWNMDVTDMRRFFKFYDRLQCCGIDKLLEIFSYATERKSFSW